MLIASHSRGYLRRVTTGRTFFICVLNFVLIAAITCVCWNFAAAQVSERAKPVSSPSSLHREKAIMEMQQGQTSAALAEFREAVAAPRRCGLT
jgi:cytochrome c biogenesis protein ResB